jgi:hypothetical protein
MIICTRPIIFLLLKEKLGYISSVGQTIRIASDPVVAVLKTCLEGATKIVNILSALHERDLVGKSQDSIGYNTY